MFIKVGETMSFDRIAENYILAYHQSLYKYSMLAPTSNQESWDICYFTEISGQLGCYNINYAQVKSWDCNLSNSGAIKINLVKTKKANVEFVYLVIYNHVKHSKFPALYKFPVTMMKNRVSG